MSKAIIGSKVDMLRDNTTPDAESESFQTAGWLFKSIQIINSGSETVKIMKSLNGTDWVQHGEDITDTGALIAINEVTWFLKVTRGSGATPVTALLAVEVPAES